jgi:hypothetical protein
MTTDPPDGNGPEPTRPAPACACRRCGRALTPGRGELYVVSALAVADPYPPVFTQDDLAQDVGSEIRVFHLCTTCYERWLEEPAGRQDPAGT